MPSDPAHTPPDVVALDELITARTAGNGVHWSMAAGRDLNANLVHLDPGGRIGQHVNAEVDVLIVVLSGEGRLVLDGAGRDLAPHVLALAPAGARREIVAGRRGMTYLTIHRRRGLLGIGPASRLVGVPVDEGGEAPCFAHLLDEPLP